MTDLTNHIGEMGWSIRDGFQRIERHSGGCVGHGNHAYYSGRYGSDAAPSLWLATEIPAGLQRYAQPDWSKVEVGTEIVHRNNHSGRRTFLALWDDTVWYVQHTGAGRSPTFAPPNQVRLKGPADED